MRSVRVNTWHGAAGKWACLVCVLTLGIVLYPPESWGWSDEPVEPGPMLKAHGAWTFATEHVHEGVLHEVSGKRAGGWRVEAGRVQLGASGAFVAQGGVHLSGPEKIHVTASSVTFEGDVAVSVDATLVGEGWTMRARKIEVNVTRAQVRMEGVRGGSGQEKE